VIHTLQHNFSRSDFQATLRGTPAHWVDTGWDNGKGADLHCGSYIAACVWPNLKDGYTWRTGMCGAHNHADSLEEGKELCIKWLGVTLQ